jgi:uncharacterized protein (TIGR02268 family)
MRNFLPSWYVLPLTLVASVAVARNPDDKIVIRTLMVSEHPGNATDNIYVSGQVATVLRFEQEVDPAKTKLLGWEGRFEPLMVGSKNVVLEPIRDLGRDEGVPLVVTLVDGTVFPFLVRPQRREDWGWTDHQVNVFKDRESYNAVLSSLNDSLKRERELREENERLKQEEISVDHALAALLVRGEVEKTPFRRKRVSVLEDGGIEIRVEVFAGPGKAAAVIRLTNAYSEEPWRFRDARLIGDISSYASLPFALRLDHPEIAPGQSGTIAVVADRSAFESKEGLRDLALEIFRQDGERQVIVSLDHGLIRK